jgi:hypothetical protein
VVFYTDSENGKPSRRVWDLLTQHLPSPRGVGHRYDSETNPLRHNFFGRKLTEDNVHQYSMLRYGTRVFGWEMPWWGRDEGDPAGNARRMGFEYARAFLEVVDSKWTPPAEAPVIEAGRWHMHEFVLHGRAHVANPFRDAALVGEFTSPSGQVRVVEGFHDGGDAWRLRFAPDEEGEWSYLLRGEGVELFRRGRMQVKPGTGHGFVGIHPQNPYAFAYSDGTPFFPMGDTCYGLFDDSPITPALRTEYLETRRRQRFNFVRMSIGHSPYRAAADSAYWAWGGTAAQPDLDRFNPVFFAAFDRLLLEMRSRGMMAELLLFNYYRKPFTDPAQWTQARERQWLRYVIARYAAFDNIFVWTLSNEYETHPDGRYRLDLPGDVEWAKAMGRLVKQLDPHRHPFTVHPVISSSTKGDRPGKDFEPPWRIGGFFGEGNEVDVLSQQTSLAIGGRWDEALGAWTGDAAGVEASIAADRKYGKPVLNTENGYEYLPGPATNRQQVHHTDKVRRASWRIVCAGGYFAAGFLGTIGHSDYWDRIEPASKHPFLVTDSGAAAHLAQLYGFFEDLPFWRMGPRQEMLRGDGVCLASPGEVYAVYMPRGGKVELDLGSLTSRLTARWFNPRQGGFGESAEIPGGGWREFHAPDNQDWVLLIR